MQAQWACGPKMEHEEEQNSTTGHIRFTNHVSIYSNSLRRSIASTETQHDTEYVNGGKINSAAVHNFHSWPQCCEGVKDRAG